MLTERLSTLKDYFFDGHHHGVRRTPESLGLDKLCEQYAAQGLPAETRAARLFDAMIEAEEPYIFEGELIVATRTITAVPSYFTKAEWDDIKARHYLHENGMLSNISADYNSFLQ